MMPFLRNIEINNFRCFEKMKLTFSPGLNIIIGENGIGKTAVAEAISYVCLGKSFKKAKDKDVLMHDKPFFNIIAEICAESSFEITVGFDGIRKKIKKDGYVYKRLSEFVGQNLLVSFSPRDLDIIYGYSGERRGFLDNFISQEDGKYLNNLLAYRKILRQRNEYLKTVKQVDNIYIGLLDEKLTNYGKYIIEARRKHIDLLNKELKSTSFFLSSGYETINIKYKENVSENEFETKIKAALGLDLMLKTTTAGPHKDDILIYINGLSAAKFASRGQIRSIVIGLKLAVYNLFRKEGKPALVILDDVLSELDVKRQFMLLENLKNCEQVFITTTDVKQIPREVVLCGCITDLTEARSGS